MNEIKVALIPAYEPDERLVNLVSGLKDNDFVIIVVDDGSGDEYDRIFAATSKNAVVLTHGSNRGKGSALKTGLSYIKTCFGRHCVVVTLDADGQHNVADAVNVCNAASLYPDELILGTREFEGDVPVKSKLGNKITRFVYHVFTGVYISDTQTGLRAFHGRMIDELLAVEGERYEYEMNMLLTFAGKEINMREIPIETIYENNNERSHFDAISDSLLIYKEIIKFSASSFLSFLVDYFMYLLILSIAGWQSLSHPIVMANVGARLVSGTFNYSVNKHAVFDDGESAKASALKYALLAVSILMFNTVCLEFLVNLLGIHAYLAKVLVECMMFVISFLAQKYLVFSVGGKESLA